MSSITIAKNCSKRDSERDDGGKEKRSYAVGFKNEPEIMCVHVKRMFHEMEIPMLRY